jgi:hypothetical protein
MSDLTCRGSIALGSGCGTCSKCLKEIEQLSNNISKYNKKLGLDSPELYMLGKYPEKYGWICPRCSTVNAPYITNCSCSK